ncbi:hypothetical protein INR49_001433 [Caranx melampygus]|nr:hypothetical protein INR49_001433 [Caranx melampygus]
MGGDSDDHDDDKSDEEAFHPNYIPQCFFIDGSRRKMTKTDSSVLLTKSVASPLQQGAMRAKPDTRSSGEEEEA